MSDVYKEKCKRKLTVGKYKQMSLKNKIKNILSF